MPTSFAEHTRKREEQTGLWKQWRTKPTPDTKAPLMDLLRPTIDSALRTHAGGDESYRPRAMIMASEALDNFDPKGGASLSSHVFSRLQRLSRVRAGREQSLKIPENVRFDWAAVRRAETELEATTGRPPNLDEVADATGLSPKRIVKARRALEAPQASVTSEKGDDMVLTSTHSASDIWRDYVYHDLDNIGKKVFEWVSGYGGSKVLPKQEIARRLGITPAAVSSRITTITKRLAEVSA